MSDIDLSLLPDFIVEAVEHLEDVETLLLQLGADPHNTTILNDIFRPIHTIKGGAQYIGLQKVSRLSHRLEDLLDQLRSGEKASGPELVELLIAARDRIALLVEELEQHQEEITEVDDLVDQLSTYIEGETAPAPTPTSTEVPEEIEISVAESQETAPAPAGGGDEEHDAELYRIFITHLAEKLRDIHDLAEMLEGDPEPASLLQEIATSVQTLLSPANYMDYEDLVELYQGWLEQLEVSIDSGAGDFTYIQNYLDVLQERFPQLLDMAQSPEVVEEAPSTGDVTADISKMFAEEPVSEGTSAPIEISIEPAAETEQPQAAPPAEEEESAEDIDYSLLPDLIVEAVEHLDDMEVQLLKLQQDPENTEIFNDIFRPMHTIKGGAQYIGLVRVSKLAHRLEDLLDLLRSGDMKSSPAIVDLLMEGRDRIASLIEELENQQQEVTAVQDLIARVAEIIDAGGAGQPAPTAEAEPSETESSVVEKEAPSATPTQAGSASAVINEADEQENDEELFGIFREHLKEQLAEICARLRDFDICPDKIICLDEIEERLIALRSSANYMGYVELVSQYNAWLRTANNANDEVTSSGRIDMDAMLEHLRDVTDMFSSIDYSELMGSTGTTAAPPVEVPQPVVSQAADESTSSTTDEMTGKMLEEALQRNLQGRSARENGALGEVFDELLSQQGVAIPEAPQPQQATQAEPVALAENAPIKTESEEEKKPAAPKKAAEKIVKKSMRVDADKIDTLMNQVGELVVDRSYFFQLFEEMRDLTIYLKDTIGLDQKQIKDVRDFTYRLNEAIAALSRTSNDLQEGVMKMRMLPISQIFNRYPRLVHDLTHKIDKKVKLDVHGEDTELDKMIVEELSDPLIHIIRNSVDHGIETVPERIAAGKPEEATLTLEAYQESNHIVIEITDDGRGINLDKIREKALSKGLVTVEDLERMTDKEVTALITMPGFSTADKISGTSGRGVGMDVVKRNIERLNGTLEMESEQGQFTQMRLKIPLTLAIIHALMVKVAGDFYTIPLANVEETIRVEEADTSHIEGTEVVHIRGETLPIFRLKEIFGLPENGEGEKAFVVIVDTGGQRLGFVVDELLGQQEVVIKPLADYIHDRSGFSGATIIGDGRISLILDVYEMAKMVDENQVIKQKVRTAERKKRKRRLDDNEASPA